MAIKLKLRIEVKYKYNFFFARLKLLSFLNFLSFWRGNGTKILLPCSFPDVLVISASRANLTDDLNANHFVSLGNDIVRTENLEEPMTAEVNDRFDGYSHHTEEHHKHEDNQRQCGEQAIQREEYLVLVRHNQMYGENGPKVPIECFPLHNVEADEEQTDCLDQSEPLAVYQEHCPELPLVDWSVEESVGIRLPGSVTNIASLLPIEDDVCDTILAAKTIVTSALAELVAEPANRWIAVSQFLEFRTAVDTTWEVYVGVIWSVLEYLGGIWRVKPLIFFWRILVFCHCRWMHSSTTAS